MDLTDPAKLKEDVITVFTDVKFMKQWCGFLTVCTRKRSSSQKKVKVIKDQILVLLQEVIEMTVVFLSFIFSLLVDIQALSVWCGGPDLLGMGSKARRPQDVRIWTRKRHFNLVTKVSGMKHFLKLLIEMSIHSRISCSVFVMSKICIITIFSFPKSVF